MLVDSHRSPYCCFLKQSDLCLWVVNRGLPLRSRSHLEILEYRLAYVSEGWNYEVEELWILLGQFVSKWLVYDAVACQIIWVDSWLPRPVVSTNSSLTRASLAISFTNASFYSISICSYSSSNDLSWIFSVLARPVALFLLTCYVHLYFDQSALTELQAASVLVIKT